MPRLFTYRIQSVRWMRLIPTNELSARLCKPRILACVYTRKVDAEWLLEKKEFTDREFKHDP